MVDLTKQENFLNDRTMKPKTVANSQGQQQGLKMAVQNRGRGCNTIDLSMMVGKQQWINMSLPTVEFQTFVDAVKECAASREFVPLTIAEERKGAIHATLTVQRNQEGMVVAILESQGKSVEVRWMPLKQYPMKRGGGQMSVAESSERNARAWASQQHRLIDRLAEMYEPFNPNGGNGGGNYGGGNGGNYGGGNGGGYQPQPQAPTTSVDNYF